MLLAGNSPALPRIVTGAAQSAMCGPQAVRTIWRMAAWSRTPSRSRPMRAHARRNYMTAEVIRLTLMRLRGSSSTFVRKGSCMEDPMKISRKAELSLLHRSVHVCTQCVLVPGCLMQQDSMKVPRQSPEHAIESRIFIVEQALGL